MDADRCGVTGLCHRRPDEAVPGVVCRASEEEEIGK